MLSDLQRFEARIHSQNGEDGVLARLFELLGVTNRFFVEFGAGADGQERNTRRLEEQGWSGVLWDAAADGRDQRVFREHVTAENINGLFVKYAIPDEFDLLSIDIDGNDYWVWRAMSDRYRPRVIVIEYNASIPPSESRAIAYDPDFRWQITDYYGASLLALARLGRRKGYELVYCDSSGVQAFFVRADLCTEPAATVSELYRPLAARHGSAYPTDARRMISVESREITGVILARNEEFNIRPCAEALRPHVAELILVDMESTDCTRELAAPIVDRIISHPLVAQFDAARNVAIGEAKHDWLWFVDADEHVPDHTGRAIAELVRDRGDEFEAILYPFATYFSGHWMQHCGWWPGYCMPRVLKRGHFRFSEVLHAGVQVEGRQFTLGPAERFAVPHYSFRSVEHWIDKFNRYTSIESLQLAQRGIRWNWRLAARALAHDLWEHYELNNARADGNQGWIVTWAASQYRWFTYAKLIDHFPEQTEDPQPASVPESLDEALQTISDELATFRAPHPRLPLGVVWQSPIWDYSGYADESRMCIRALARSARHLAVEEIAWSSSRCQLPEDDAALLTALTRVRRAPYVIKITCCIPTLVAPDVGASYNVLRTTFETDRIPDYWLPRLAAFDEIWVMSHSDYRAFCRSGVAPEKLRVLPCTLDTQVFTPLGPSCPLPEACADRFVFLSVFDWQLRKGWDVLLSAFVNEFRVDEGAVLLLKVSGVHGHSSASIRRQADTVLAHSGASLANRPDIVLYDAQLTALEMASLYRSVQAFVLPTRGEGWGKPFMEAMACGTPVVGTALSGNADFMHAANCLVVEAEWADVPPAAVAEIPPYAGHRWLEPDPQSLRIALRRVFDDARWRDALRARASREVAVGFDIEAGRRNLNQLIDDVEARFAAPSLPVVEPQQIRLAIEGEFFAAHSFANVNEQLALHFLERPEIALALRRFHMAPAYDREAVSAARLRGYFDRPLEGGVQISIRHSFPARWEVPTQGAWVHIQPWEASYLPQDWIEPLTRRVHEIWAPSRFVRETYIRSGIPAEKVHLIPWGVDTRWFRPEAPPRLLPTNKQFVFAFVGGTIRRKGFDLLLRAYLQEFTADDDVCLVVKDLGATTFYHHISHADPIRAAAKEPQNPQIIYLDERWTPGQIAGLLTACQCLVAPYRGEGFGLPILEAMACGLAPIIPRGGPTDDFTDESTAYYVASRLVPAEAVEQLCGPGQEIEVDLADLRRQMRSAFAHPEQTRLRGLAAAQHVAEHYTWRQTVSRMCDRLQAIALSHSAQNMPTVEPPSAAAPRIPLVKNVVACCMVHDEERVLGDCLARIAPFVSELVVADCGSSDRSPSIAREYGARVARIENEVDDDQIRQACFNGTQAEWVLWLHPSQQLDDEHIQWLCRAAQSQATDKACGEAQRHARAPLLLERIRHSAPLAEQDLDRFMKAFAQNFQPHLAQRSTSFENVFRLLGSLRRSNCLILETGCVRKTHDWGDGQSTLLFDRFVNLCGGRVFSVDLSAENCAFARRHCSGKTTIVQDDSVAFLRKFASAHPASVDLIYLDSFDLDWNDPRPSALHHLQEISSALPALKRGAVVFVDDHRDTLGRPGKSMFVADYLACIGAKLIWEGYQVAWRLP